MKIATAQQNLSSSHLEVEQREVSERLRAWTGNRPPRGENENPAANRAATADSAPTSISTLARALAEAHRDASPLLQAPETSAIAAAMDGTDNDPTLALLRNLLERVFGIHIKTFDPSELEADTSLQQVQSGTVATNGSGWGVEYEYHEQRSEIETTRFAAEGRITTTDGQTFEFKLELEMTRSFSERIDINYRAGDAVRQKDPLLVNFAGSAAQLADQRFEIDLDDDGRNESARFAAHGSGFLVFDRNADGKINSGQEMFGPSSGDGFAELAVFDGDGNGWIDEDDPIFAQLKVWTKNADGSDVLRTLKESDVGAISLARLATPFAIKDGSNTQLGQVRSSGVYLSDDGRVGTVQQVDLAV